MLSRSINGTLSVYFLLLGVNARFKMNTKWYLLVKVDIRKKNRERKKYTRGIYYNETKGKIGGISLRFFF